MEKKSNVNISNDELNGLRESDLTKYLEVIFPDEKFERKKRITNLSVAEQKRARRKWFEVDCLCESKKIVIEIDGDNKSKRGHYSNASYILDDYARDEILQARGYTVIRIPAFIQLSKEVVKLLFNVDLENDLYKLCNKHGFMHPEIALPADFCELGIERFKNDLVRFDIVREKIVDTIKKRIETDGIERVLPKSLHSILN